MSQQKKTACNISGPFPLSDWGHFIPAIPAYVHHLILTANETKTWLVMPLCCL